METDPSPMLVTTHDGIGPTDKQSNKLSPPDQSRNPNYNGRSD